MNSRHPFALAVAALFLGLAQPAAAGPVENPWHLQPPPNDMKRSNLRGAIVNQRTIEMVRRAELLMAALGHPGFQFVITQGSYNTSVSASAGTHAGGGALDIRTRGHAREVVDAMVQALRVAGFAAWSRGRGHDSFPPHIHAVAIGDPELSSGARSQVADYAAGLSGLRGDGPDPDGGLGREAPLWAYGTLGWALPLPPPGPTPAEIAKEKAAEKKAAEKKAAEKKAAEIARKLTELRKRERALMLARRVFRRFGGGDKTKDGAVTVTERRTPRAPPRRGMLGAFPR